MAPKLSHYNVVMDEDEIRSSNNKERSHKISTIPLAKALYSASIEDLVTMHYFLDFHEIGVEPKYTR